MAMSTTLVLENLTYRDIPPLWVKKFRPGQRFTVCIISEEVSVPTPMTKKVSMQKESH